MLFEIAMKGKCEVMKKCIYLLLTGVVCILMVACSGKNSHEGEAKTSETETAPEEETVSDSVAENPSKKIIAIATGWDNTVILREDGSVQSTDGFDSETEFDYGNGGYDWQNIIAVDSGWDRIIGLRQDGTVLSSDYKDDVATWTDIVAISTGRSSESIIAGLKKDGTIITTAWREEYEVVETWTNITQISVGGNCILGLKKDGTVVASGVTNEYVSSWKNVIQISAGESGEVALLEDGTVVSTMHQDEISNWKDIVAVSSGGQIIGLKKDGTVVSTEFLGEANYEQLGHNLNEIYQINQWTDIVAVCSSPFHIAGVKSDGTIVATGYNDHRQTNVDQFNDN